MKNYTVPEDVLTKVLNYLASRPYVEVFELVRAIQGSSKVVEDAAPTPPAAAPAPEADNTDATAQAN